MGHSSLCLPGKSQPMTSRSTNSLRYKDILCELHVPRFCKAFSQFLCVLLDLRHSENNVNPFILHRIMLHLTQVDYLVGKRSIPCTAVKVQKYWFLLILFYNTCNNKIHPIFKENWVSNSEIYLSESMKHLPSFSQPDWVTRFGYTERIRYTYYLKQGRPAFAFLSFLSEEIDSVSQEVCPQRYASLSDERQKSLFKVAKLSFYLVREISKSLHLQVQRRILDNYDWHSLEDTLSQVHRHFRCIFYSC